MGLSAPDMGESFDHCSKSIKGAVTWSNLDHPMAYLYFSIRRMKVEIVGISLSLLLLADPVFWCR